MYIDYFHCNNYNRDCTTKETKIYIVTLKIILLFCYYSSTKTFCYLKKTIF